MNNKFNSKIDPEILKLINNNLMTDEQVKIYDKNYSIIENEHESEDNKKKAECVLDDLLADKSDQSVLNKVLNYFNDNKKLVNEPINQEGDTILHVAVISRFGVSVLEHLTTKLKNDINLNIQNNDNETPLCFAVRLANIEIAEILLNAGADPTIKNEYNESVEQIMINQGAQNDYTCGKLKDALDENLKRRQVATNLDFDRTTTNSQKTQGQ